MYEFAVTPAVTQARRPGVTIDSIEPKSLGEELGLEAGDRIVKVNGRNVRDYLDFRFQTSGEVLLTFLVRKHNGETWELDLERDEGEDFGLNFEQIVPRQCANECLFCFCKGNPEDARPSLFVRDEDIRLSFLYGNYTTLSSVTDDELNRIIEQRLSPQYVSVHATDVSTRAKLLGVDEKRADISDKVRFLLDNQIEIHAQVVLCPGINDGAQLEKTLRDLAVDFPGVVSVAVVPVALTRFNNDERLTRVTSEFCQQAIYQVSQLQKEFHNSFGTNFVFLGDEIYLKAGAEIPTQEEYGDYPQIEDGVGMIRSFLNEFSQLIDELNGEKVKGNVAQSVDLRTNVAAVTPHSNEEKRAFPKSLNGTLITGEMFAPILQKEILKVNELIDGELKVVPIPNTYFGGDVSVAGLISGQDIIAAKESFEGEFLIIPEQIIKSDEPILIDGFAYLALEAQLPMPVFPMGINDLVNYLSGFAD